MVNADKLAFNDPKTGLKSMSTPCVTLLSLVWEGMLPPRRSRDSEKIFGQSPVVFQRLQSVDVNVLLLDLWLSEGVMFFFFFFFFFQIDLKK